MTQFNVKLDEQEMKNLVAESVLMQLSEESRAALIKDALAFVLSGPSEKDAFGRLTTQPAPITLAFHRAAEQAVNAIVKDLLAQNAEFQTTLRNMISDTMQQAMDNDYDFEQIVLGALTEALRRAWLDKKNGYHN